jgi:hypothetical protein
MKKIITRPKIGDTRIYFTFILFPKTLQNNGNWIKRWCEKVQILERYCLGVGQDDNNKWVDQSWADLHY